MDPNAAKSAKRPRRLWLTALKVIALTVMALVLLVGGLTVALVSLLPPERLTPLAERVATRSLKDAEVSADRIEFKLKSTWPFLTLEIDNLAVTSTLMRRERPHLREQIPAWADTVFAAESFTGGVNIARLATGVIALSDVILTTPQANLVVINDKLTNFDIIPPSAEPEKEEEPFDITTLPPLLIRRLAIEKPGPIRYFDYKTATFVTAALDRAAVDDNEAPLYRLRFGGDISTPTLMEYLAVDCLTFGLDGDIRWDRNKPSQLSIADMRFALTPVSGKINTDLDFGNGLLIKTLDFVIDPLEVSRAISILPEGMPMIHDIRSTAAIAARGRLTRPFRPGAEVIPHAEINIDIPDATVQWRRAKINNIAANVDITVAGDDLDAAVVKVNRFNMRGPATDLTIKARLSNLLTDPLAEGTVTGHCNLSHLPQVLTAIIPGSVSGTVNADATFRGRPSMLTPQNFHRLHADGSLSLSNFYWLGPDTINMVYARTAKLKFGTDTRVHTTDSGVSDSLLTASITVDSAAILHSDISMHVRDFAIGLGVKNRHRARNSRQILPMGGKVSIDAFDLTVLTDSTRIRIKDAEGMAAVSAYADDTRRPQFDVNLGIARVIIGNRLTRFMIRDAKTDLTAHFEPQTRRARAVAHLADSLRRRHPHIAPDSVYALALAIHNRKAHHVRRFAPELIGDSIEVIDFEVPTGMQRILTNWAIRGSLSARNAGLFTPFLPLRNRMRNLDIAFNNDSININSVTYRGGRSDFNLTGRISNVRRALTSRRKKQSLRINLSLASDTVDINQLAEAAFRGSSFAAHADSTISINLNSTDDEHQLQKVITAHQAQAVADTMKALLIPRNIEADLALNAENVIYGDLLMHNLSGKMLALDGAINLHRLAAKSDVGSIDLSALYVGRDTADLKFGFGMRLDRFNLHKFLDLVPAVDSLMPIMRDFGGIITADIAAASDITRSMDLDLPTLNAAIKLSGDSLVLLDPDTFKMLSKWLFFKDKKHNIIKSMSVEMLVRNNNMQMFPFIFDIDRYRLGVQGNNDFALNFNYHIAVLKSPIPFRFGINIKGNPDDFKIRLGKARFNEKTPINVALVDNTRVNLIREIEDVFRRGVREARFSSLNTRMPKADDFAGQADQPISAADSAQFIREGLIEAPDTTATAIPDKKDKKKKKKKADK